MKKTPISILNHIMCLICCEENKNNVSCPYCQFESCRKCAERYLTETTQTAHCMSCRKGWGTNLIFDLFDKRFYDKKYKPHLVNMLIMEEKSHFPELQEAAKEYKKLVEEEEKLRLECETINKEIKKEWKKHEQLRKEYRRLFDPIITTIAELFPEINRKKYQYCRENLHTNFLFTKVEKEKYFAKKEFKVLVKEMETLLKQYRSRAKQLELWKLQRDKSHIRTIQSQRRSTKNNILNGKTTITNKTIYTYPCSVEACNGFLDEKWNCGLCDEKTCSQCFRVKNVQHTCKDDDVESVKLLKKETKPCPKCATFIFKTSGCDQMFCTNCHVAFSWKTLQIENGAVHNPHYFEWLANNAIGFELPLGDGNRCQEDFRLYHIPASKRTGYTYQLVCNIYQKALEVETEWFRRSRNCLPVTPEDLRKNNILFLAGERSEKSWKTTLTRYRKQMDKEQELNSIYRMFRSAVLDILRYYYSQDRTEQFDLKESIVQVVQLMNKNLNRAATLYSTVVVSYLGEYATGFAWTRNYSYAKCS